MVPAADNPAPWSITRAFVVQLRADTAIEQGHLAGRVEHVVSGQATDFETLECCWRSWRGRSAPSVSAPPSHNGHAWRAKRGEGGRQQL